MSLARLAALAGTAAMALLYSACDTTTTESTVISTTVVTSGDQAPGTPVGGAASGVAHVRAIHASPDPLATRVVVSMDNQPTPVIPNLTYRNAVGYADISAQQHTVQVRLPGMAANSPPALSWNTPVLQPDHTYTIIAIGLALEPPPVTFALDEDNATAPEAGHTNVRFFNAMIGASSLDLCTNTNVPVVADVGFGLFGLSFTDPTAHYNDNPSGTANLIVRQHAASPPCSGHPVGAVIVPLIDRGNQTLIMIGRDAHRGVGTQPVPTQLLSCQDAPIARGAASCTTLNVVAIPGMH